MRVRMETFRMTMDEADCLQYYLQAVPGVTSVKVHERTRNAVIFFETDKRDAVVNALARYGGPDTAVSVPEHTGRALTRAYEDRFFFLVVRRVITRFLLPAPVRALVTALRSVRYIAKGLLSLRKRRLEVSVLDATTIAVSMIRGDFATAGTVMFLLDIGEILEEWTHKKSVDDLAQRMVLNVDKVWIKAQDTEVLIPITDVVAGDLIVARTGNLIPLDGTVESGEGSVNQSSMTGESMPVRKEAGILGYAGTVLE